MSTESNKTLARRIPLEGFNQGNVAVFDEIVAVDVADHAPAPGMPPGREGYKRFVPALRAAFPDLRYTLDLEVAEGDKVAQHLTARGTQQGAFMGIPPTGKSVNWTETHILRFADGQAVEHWANVDQAGLMQQLMPAQGQVK